MASNRNEILVHLNRGRVRDRIADESKPGKDEWPAPFFSYPARSLHLKSPPSDLPVAAASNMLGF
jgi:hypothetical protein